MTKRGPYRKGPFPVGDHMPIAIPPRTRTLKYSGDIDVQNIAKKLMGEGASEREAIFTALEAINPSPNVDISDAYQRIRAQLRTINS